MIALTLDRQDLVAPVDNLRRGACPALSAPMMTGDGLLARVALADAVTPLQLEALCRLALTHGNGMIDVTARGNLQIRGLTQATASLLDADVRALDLPLREGLAVETPPLSGLDSTEIADPRPLADAIRQGARTILGLAPKLSVVVDGSGQLGLSGLLADVRLVATRTDDGLRWKVFLGGTEESGHVFNVLRETLAIEATLDLLHTLAMRGPKARGRDLTQGLLANQAHPKATSPFGLFALAQDRFAAGIGPAFGQAKADQLIALCTEAERLGIAAVRPALDHALLFIGPEVAVRALQSFAASHGFVIAADDPRSHIAACPGSPACASGTIAPHDIAAQAARECPGLLDGSFKLHVSGCPKGCAHPQPTALSLCGVAEGVLLVEGGKAADLPFASIDFADTNATLIRLSDLVTSEKREGETSAACLARLGPAQLAAATGQS
jgi:precorrin-3B synthase